MTSKCTCICEATRDQSMVPPPGFGFVFTLLAKRLAENSVPKTSHFVSSVTLTFNSVSQSVNQSINRWCVLSSLLIWVQPVSRPRTRCTLMCWLQRDRPRLQRQRRQQHCRIILICTCLTDLAFYPLFLAASHSCSLFRGFYLPNLDAKFKSNQIY